ncbi:HAD family hydrolase [Aggregicoccus sp. 17bor-14]|uniref:HAD family hydrolase n=1 Tax=Myxococcaceae TaxID=31 RepID=UPI00129C99E9|nr:MULTISPECIES: haloacid dehalogenase-like hydrolase [Myxococcaceae]MBF5041189.1 haloacid dehalogenase-like hydrolase [Simulacricoccus sp. 17bor-14]MRI86976.1 HAD family hydrolase [Aggregicoccus sp. 17bor-14]
MQPTVLLFDIDGTLVTTGGAGRRAMELAFERLHGRRDACDSFKMSGMTDRAIVRKGLEVIGVQPTEPAIDALIAAYIAGLHEEIPKVQDRDYVLHPGMREAVEAASARSGFAVGLGTGNVRPGAKVKLERVQLYEPFRFGGFGCDAEDRTELIRHGARAGAALLGAPLEACRVVVIGDTPKDVAAAKGIGATTIGVGTGSYSAQELQAAGAEFAFDDFTAPGALQALLHGR